jgi:hypothetical protein
MPEKFTHKGLAEPHYLIFTFTLGIKIAAPFTAADGSSGKGVFKDLFKPQEFDDPQIDRRMEPQPSLVGPQGAVKLYPKTPVYLHLALIINPGDPEYHLPFRLHNPFHNFQLGNLRPFPHHRIQGFKYFLHRLNKLRFRRIPGGNRG